MAKVILVNDVNEELELVKHISIVNPEYFLSSFIGIYFKDEVGCIIEEANIPLEVESIELIKLYNLYLKDRIANKFLFLTRLYTDISYVLDIEIDKTGTAYVTFER